MRAASGKAASAARTIAPLVVRIDIVMPSWTSRVAETRKPRVNPGQSHALLAENRRRGQVS
jgi:hypothetical protein